MLSNRTISLLLLIIFMTGCSSLKPWVASHERGLLADPIMSFERDGTSARYMNHVYEARESARGAEGSSGGGCGCN